MLVQLGTEMALMMMNSTDRNDTKVINTDFIVALLVFECQCNAAVDIVSAHSFTYQ